MDSGWGNIFGGYWSSTEIHVNIIIFLNLLGSMALGLFVGYERSFHGRAAGMRTYGLVCMASTALVVISGYPHYWFGEESTVIVGADPTRVIQGVVTGIGFLGAGVIMREGFNISGLTTAASIWASSAIGILVGVGFYASAILLTILSAISMMWVSKLENWLPSHKAVAIVLTFAKDFMPDLEILRQTMKALEYQIAEGTLAISKTGEREEWRLVALDTSLNSTPQIDLLSRRLDTMEGVEDYQISHARN